MKYKSDALDVLKLFINFVENQFGKTVKKVKSDNALEIKGGKCKEYFCEKGIIHQISCVDRPQQNGRAEGKHRNILEMVRALRLQANLPLKYWGDCVLTSVYIINRLPNIVMENVYLYEKLFGKKPNYDSLRAFGCLVMAYNPSRDKDKFSLRGVPCVFLGYPNDQKGYKVLNVINGQTLVSRDMRFFEHIHPCHKGAKAQYSQPVLADITNTTCQLEYDYAGEIEYEQNEDAMTEPTPTHVGP